MGNTTEPLDSLSGRIATGIHQVAAATICAKSATREELDLAALVLRRDPGHAAPRENESEVESFNRILDAALDSANQSAGCGSRAERRSRLAGDIGRAGLVLIDAEQLAEYVSAWLELEGQKHGPIEAPGPTLMLEALHALEALYAEQVDG